MFSVVIPLYNKAPHIGKAIESALGQTVQPIEIIVVDDGSTDGGAQIVGKYAGRGVRYIYQKNQGVSVARNQGINLAKGKYIAFLDADDWWLPNHIEVLLSLISAFPEAKLYSTSFYIHRNNQSYRPRSQYKEGSLGLVQEFFSDYATGLSLVSSITACARRADLISVGGFPVGVRRGEDIICWINLALSGRVAHAETPTAVYFHDGVNRSNHVKSNALPGSIAYLSQLIGSSALTGGQRIGVIRLFERIAFFTAAGFSMDGNKHGVGQIFFLAIRMRRYKLSVSLSMLFLAPVRLLDFARRIRHPKASAPLGE